MAYLPELHYCCICQEDLGPDNRDGICGFCDTNICACGHDLEDHWSMGCVKCVCSYFEPPEELEDNL